MRNVFSIMILFVAAFRMSLAAEIQTGRSEVERFALVSTEEISVKGIAACRNGRLWLATDRLVSDGSRSLVLSCSDAPETGWTDVAVVSSADGGVLWTAPNGGLFIFFTVNSEIYVASSPNPADISPVWTAAVKVGAGSVTGTPVVCSDRRWALPVMREGVGPFVFRSADMGRSWTESEGPRNIPEMQKADRNNPQLYLNSLGQLSMVCCSMGTSYSYLSVSPDNGRTWNKAERFCHNPDRNMGIVNLAPGNVLTVKNDRIDHRAFSYAKGLYAYLTPVDGRLWHGGLQIDAREEAVSPVVAVSGGRIHIAYTYNVRGRNEICLVVTDELEVAQAWGLLDCAPRTRMTVMTAGQSEELFKKRLDAARNSGKKQVWAKETIRVATYNIQWYGYVKKPTWDERLVALKKLFDDNAFDIVGVQEPDTMMVNTLVKTLGGRYDWVGLVEASDNTSSGFIPLNPIFYNVERFECLSQDIFWFGHAHGTIGYDSWGMRLCNYAKFRDRQTDMEFYVFNSHYDHRGHEAKEVSSTVLLNKVMEIAEGLPVVLTGDFNTDENTPGYRKLVESGIVDDAMLALPASKRVNWEYFSMANYKPKETIRKNNLHIDHIFYTPATSKVQSWRLILDSHEGVFGSDHLPIVIDWKIAN